MNVAY
jgi:hypothetical protein